MALATRALGTLGIIHNAAKKIEGKVIENKD